MNTPLQELATRGNFKYRVEDGIEVLEVSRPDPFESFMLSQSGSRPVLVTYSGDSDEMRRTVASLDIPDSWPQNVGEKIIYLMRGKLSLSKGETTITERISLGKEQQFEHVLEKLAQRYIGRKPF